MGNFSDITEVLYGVDVTEAAECSLKGKHCKGLFILVGGITFLSSSNIQNTDCNILKPSDYILVGFNKNK